MKNKFLKISLMLVFLSTILIFSNNYMIQNVEADSGWDTSYDSGGSWDSGSSWDSSSSWSSSSGSSHSSGGGEFGPFTALFMSAFVTIHYFAFVINPISIKLSSGDNEKKKKMASKLLIFRLVIVGLLDIIFPVFAGIDFLLLFVLAFICMPILTKSHNTRTFNYKQITLEEANRVIPNFNIEEFNFKAYQIFYDVQIAWMNFDYDKMKKLLTDELYNTYLMDLEALKIKGHKNTMKDFELIETKLIDLKEENSTYVAKTYLKVKFYDYVENLDTGMVLRGTDRRKLTNTYILTFVKSKDEVKVNYCPMCGAKVEGNQTGECAYCKSKLINDTYEWVMSKKEKISQK